jgi:hypothetical protein
VEVVKVGEEEKDEPGDEKDVADILSKGENDEWSSDSKIVEAKEDEEDASKPPVGNELKEWKRSQRRSRGWKRKGGGEGD